jgi:hypothetical protein
MSEEFGATIDIFDEWKKQPKFRRTEFLNLGPGEHRIRILDAMETKHYTHYVGFSYLACLGSECPLCENNKKILYEHPEDFRDQKGWNPRRARFYINVFDKTPTRVCPKCGVESQGTNELCAKCGTPLGEAKPLNKVKVLSAGKELIEDLKVQSMSVRNDADERVDIRAYDWVITVRGTGRDKKTNVAHKWYPGRENVEDIGDQQLFDLENNAVVKVTREEMLDVFNGASLKDIFAVRRATKEAQKASGEDLANPLVEASVDEIFKVD